MVPPPEQAQQVVVCGEAFVDAAPAPACSSAKHMYLRSRTRYDGD